MRMIGLFVAALIMVALTQVAFAQSQEPIPERTSLDDQPPRMVSAFFGLDNDLSLIHISEPTRPY